ncbi:hypothetical protein DPMN_185232 [Dreissena polymorpha]|uniref:Uncharacterized protein n=1 Tax=Dreissena polymorpha TaxID=45954 RepID=A0A9D4I5C7_DREPO|nr:hypothetical protein DPMN_185232 [Dreissena polymorpha]
MSSEVRPNGCKTTNDIGMEGFERTECYCSTDECNGNSSVYDTSTDVYDTSTVTYKPFSSIWDIIDNRGSSVYDTSTDRYNRGSSVYVTIATVFVPLLVFSKSVF